MTYYCPYCGFKVEDSNSIHGQANKNVTVQFCEPCGQYLKNCKCEKKKED